MAEDEGVHQAASAMPAHARMSLGPSTHKAAWESIGAHNFMISIIIAIMLYIIFATSDLIMYND